MNLVDDFRKMPAYTNFIGLSTAIQTHMNHLVCLPKKERKKKRHTRLCGQKVHGGRREGRKKVYVHAVSIDPENDAKLRAFSSLSSGHDIFRVLLAERNTFFTRLSNLKRGRHFPRRSLPLSTTNHPLPGPISEHFF